jgi:hypothetical protein
LHGRFILFALLGAVMLPGIEANSGTTDASWLHPVPGPMLAVHVAYSFDALGAFSLPLICSLFPTGRFVPAIAKTDSGSYRLALLPPQVRCGSDPGGTMNTRNRGV